MDVVRLQPGGQDEKVQLEEVRQDGPEALYGQSGRRQAGRKGTPTEHQEDCLVCGQGTHGITTKRTLLQLEWTNWKFLSTIPGILQIFCALKISP